MAPLDWTRPLIRKEVNDDALTVSKSHAHPGAHGSARRRGHRDRERRQQRLEHDKRDNDGLELLRLVQWDRVDRDSRELSQHVGAKPSTRKRRGFP